MKINTGGRGRSDIREAMRENIVEGQNIFPSAWDDEILNMLHSTVAYCYNETIGTTGSFAINNINGYSLHLQVS